MTTANAIRQEVDGDNALLDITSAYDMPVCWLNSECVFTELYFIDYRMQMSIQKRTSVSIPIMTETRTEIATIVHFSAVVIERAEQQYTHRMPLHTGSAAMNDRMITCFATCHASCNQIYANDM